MRSFCLVFLLFGILVAGSSTAVTMSDRQELSRRVDIKTRYVWWVTERVVWSDSYYFGWHSDPEVDIFRPQLHLVIRPEFSLQFKRWRFSTHASVSAKTSLKEKIEGYPEDPPTVGRTGSARWSNFGADVGYGGAIVWGYFGVKSWKTTIVDWPSDSLFSHSVTDAVLGLRLNSNKFFNVGGLTVMLDIYMGVTLLSHAFNNVASVMGPQMGGLSLDFGWHPKGTPIAIMLGYGGDMYAKYIGAPNEKDHWHNLSNYAHGATLTISWFQ